VHRFAVASWSSHIYGEELVWLKDLYISCGYPPETVIQWIKSSKEVVYKNRLDWVTSHNNTGDTERIWPLKSVMNLVWQKLNLGMVSDSMRRAAGLICEDERASFAAVRRRAGLNGDGGDGPFALGIQNWFGRLVASQKRPLNFGDKENRHNRSLLGILGRHGKLALAGRSVDQREDDEVLALMPKYTLEDYGFTITVTQHGRSNFF